VKRLTPAHPQQGHWLNEAGASERRSRAREGRQLASRCRPCAQKRPNNKMSSGPWFTTFAHQAQAQAIGQVRADLKRGFILGPSVSGHSAKSPTGRMRCDLDLHRLDVSVHDDGNPSGPSPSARPGLCPARSLTASARGWFQRANLLGNNVAVGVWLWVRADSARTTNRGTSELVSVVVCSGIWSGMRGVKGEVGVLLKPELGFKLRLFSASASKSASKSVSESVSSFGIPESGIGFEDNGLRFGLRNGQIQQVHLTDSSNRGREPGRPPQGGRRRAQSVSSAGFWRRKPGGPLLGKLGPDRRGAGARAQ